VGVARGDEAVSVRGLVEWEAPADACGPCAGGDQIQGFLDRAAVAVPAAPGAECDAVLCGIAVGERHDPIGAAEKIDEGGKEPPRSFVA